MGNWEREWMGEERWVGAGQSQSAHLNPQRTVRVGQNWLVGLNETVKGGVWGGGWPITLWASFAEFAFCEQTDNGQRSHVCADWKGKSSNTHTHTRNLSLTHQHVKPQRCSPLLHHRLWKLQHDTSTPTVLLAERTKTRLFIVKMWTNFMPKLEMSITHEKHCEASCSIKPCLLIYANNDTCPHTNQDEISTVLGKLKLNLQLHKLLTEAPGSVSTHLWGSRRVQDQVGQLSEQFVKGVFHVVAGQNRPTQVSQQPGRELPVAGFGLQGQRHSQRGYLTPHGPQVQLRKHLLDMEADDVSWSWISCRLHAKYMAFQPIVLHRLVCCGSYRYFICVAVLKVLLHYGGDCLLKVPLIQRGDHSLIHTVFLTKHKHKQVKCWPALHRTAFIFLTTVWMN